MIKSNNYELAIIFDMDGVLVDNKHIHRKAWVEFCKRHNCPVTEEYFDQVGFGKNNKEYLTIFFEREVTKNEVEKYGEEKEAIYRDLIRKEIEPVDGLIPFLKEIKQSGNYKTAIASSAPRSNIDFVLEALSIHEYFNVLVDGSMVENGKPAPDIYLKTAKLLHVQTGNCLVFEDSLFGVESAGNAGMKVIALTTSHSATELQSYNPRMIIKDFREVSLEKVKGIIGK